MTNPNTSAAQAGAGDEKPPSWKAYAASGIGIEMALYVVLGYFGGGWIDTKLGTTPLFMLLMVIVGVAFGVYVMIRASRSAWGIEAPTSSATKSATASALAASKGQQ